VRSIADADYREDLVRKITAQSQASRGRMPNGGHVWTVAFERLRKSC
jgi:hypothetical protein